MGRPPPTRTRHGPGPDTDHGGCGRGTTSTTTSARISLPLSAACSSESGPASGTVNPVKKAATARTGTGQNHGVMTTITVAAFCRRFATISGSEIDLGTRGPQSTKIAGVLVAAVMQRNGEQMVRCVDDLIATTQVGAATQADRKLGTGGMSRSYGYPVLTLGP